MCEADKTQQIDFDDGGFARALVMPGLSPVEVAWA